MEKYASSIFLAIGAEDSGSLITAENAFSYSRKVYAIPGPVTSSLSAGPNKLLKKGAVFVTDAEDILRDLHVPQKSHTNQIAMQGETDEENSIISLLMVEPLTFDELVRKSHLSSDILSVTISYMEIKSMVQQYEGKYVLMYR